jgi:hypothetical protein
LTEWLKTLIVVARIPCGRFYSEILKIRLETTNSWINLEFRNTTNKELSNE